MPYLFNQKLIIAHRGARRTAHENTYEAFQKAIECGADMIECDVRSAKDGTHFLHHSPKVGTKLISATSFTELQKHAQQCGYILLTLTDALVSFGTRIAFDFELKEKPYAFDIVHEICARMGSEKCVITSFDASVIHTVKKNFPLLSAGLITPHPFKNKISRTHAGDFLVLHWMEAVPFLVVQKLSPRVPCIIYTVNNPLLAKKFLALPFVAGIITDLPERIKILSTVSLMSLVNCFSIILLISSRCSY